MHQHVAIRDNYVPMVAVRIRNNDDYHVLLCCVSRLVLEIGQPRWRAESSVPANSVEVILKVTAALARRRFRNEHFRGFGDLRPKVD